MQQSRCSRSAVCRMSIAARDLVLCSYSRLSVSLTQESRALGKSWGRVRVYKLQTICQLVADLQERLNEKHEAEHVR